jgi:hypothetical protein
MVVGFTTTYAISAYHHERYEFESCLWRAVTIAIRFIYNLSICRPISPLIIPTPLSFGQNTSSTENCVGTRVWRVWNLQSKNNFKVDFSSAAIFYSPFSSVIDRNRNRPFNLIQNKVGYRSCFATVKIIFWLQISYSPHSGTNTQIKSDMCLSILNIILRYADDKGRNWPQK